MGLRWTTSAGKHGIAREDAIHAITHAVYAESEFDEPRVPGHLRPTLFIGPPRQADGPLLEVMVEAIHRTSSWCSTSWWPEPSTCNG